MKRSSVLIAVILFALLSVAVCFHVNAQDYVSPTQPPVSGRSPGVKIKRISDTGRTQTYAIIFSPGDEIISGLKEFAETYHVTSAHFTAIGDATSAKFGWYDKSKKMFKVIHMDRPAEITSLIGDIAMNKDQPVVHAHISMATEDGMVHGGHLLEAFVAPTLEVFMTVEPVPLNKKLSPEFGALVIDPDLGN